MSLEVVPREEFDQAMAELGLTKQCSICTKEITHRSPHYDSPCRGYGYDPHYRWVKKEDLK